MAKNSEKSKSKEAVGSGGSQNKIMIVLKFIFFILLLPLVITSTIGFVKELNALPLDLTEAFVRGIFIFLIIHLFIYELQIIYQYGQNLVSIIFGFFSPLVKVAPFFLPIYSIIFLIAFYFVNLIFKSPSLGNYFMLFVGFTLAMHLVFTAKVLRGKDPNAIKPNYFFAISLIYVINIFIVAVLFNLILSDFSFANFFRASTSEAADIFKAIFKQLFVP